MTTLSADTDGNLTLSPEDERMENEELRIRALQQMPLREALKAVSTNQLQVEAEMCGMFEEMIGSLEWAYDILNQSRNITPYMRDVIDRAKALQARRSA